MRDSEPYILKMSGVAPNLVTGSAGLPLLSG